MIPQLNRRLTLVDRTQTRAGAPESAQFALSALQAALVDADVAVSIQPHLPVAIDAFTVVVGLMDDQLIRRLLRHAGVDVSAQPEGVIFRHCHLPQGQILLIAGTDARGLVYALLEAADTVRYEGLDALIQTENCVESPDLRVRGLDRFIMGPLDDVWFYNDDFWQYYLDRLVHARFNRFTLVAGFDTAYFSPPYPYFVDTPGYAHVHVSGLDAGGRARNLAQLRRIGQECHRRELDFVLATWQQTPWTENQQRQVEGLPDDESSLSDYCAAGLKTLLQQCPELDGVQLRVNHESGVGTQESNEAFWLKLIDAVAECGRPVQLDLRAKGLTNGMIQRALDGGVQLTVPTKYWCEQTGLPHHLTQMRREELTQLGNLNHSRRYSYSDLLRKPHWYDMLYRLWTLGSTTLFAWGDPDYVRRFAASCRVGEAAGFTVAATLSMKGGHASIQGEPWPIFADSALQSGQWEDERHWLFYLLYGRIGYSAQTSPQVWRSLLKSRFGAAAAALEEALASASRILPLVTAFHMPVHPMLHYWPELSTGAALFAEHNHNVRFNRGFYGQVSYGSAEPSDPGLFYGIDEYAAAEAAGQVTGKYTPLQVSEWLAGFAATVRSAVVTVVPEMVNDAEVRALHVDLHMLADLADYHVHKIHAALSLARFRHTGDRANLTAALASCRIAREFWWTLSTTGRSAYHDPLEFNAGQSRARYGQWQDYLPELDADITRLEEMLAASNEHTSTVTEPAERVSGNPSWSVLSAQVVDLPKQWRTGEDLPIHLSITTAHLAQYMTVLHFRHTNQMEGPFQQLPMQAHKDGFTAVIPGSYLQPEWDLLVYVSLALSPQGVWIYPGLYHPTQPLPYFVVTIEQAEEPL
jgi:hypothetical protein